MKTNIRIAQIKVVPEKANLKSNHVKLMSILGDIAGDSDVVVTPEAFLDGYVATEDFVTTENIADYAVEPSSSPLVKTVSQWARDNSTWVVLGCTRPSREGVYNSALVIDRTGKLAGIYDKIHCQELDKKYCSGNTLPIFDSDFGTFGVMICADRRWPEITRSIALSGARVIFTPTYGMCDELNLHMMVTRSFESEVFIAFTHPRQSLLTGPDGQIIRDEMQKDIPFTITEIDLSEVDKARTNGWCHLRDRRPEMYELNQRQPGGS